MKVTKKRSMALAPIPNVPRTEQGEIDGVYSDLPFEGARVCQWPPSS